MNFVEKEIHKELLKLTEDDFPGTQVWIVGAIRCLALKCEKLEKVHQAATWVLTHPERAGRINTLRKAVQKFYGNDNIPYIEKEPE